MRPQSDTIVRTYDVGFLLSAISGPQRMLRLLRSVTGQNE